MGRLGFTLDLTTPAQRRVSVELVATVGNLTSEGSCELYLPAWTPGSYLIREYVKHLGDFSVVDPDGRELAWRKSAKNRFRIELPDGLADDAKLRTRYTLYAHELSVRTSDLTDQHAFLSGAAVFLWPVGYASDAHDAEVVLRVPEHWQVATSLARTASGSAYRATGLDDLIDSPILAGELDTRSFTVDDKPHSLVFDGLCGIEPPESLIPDTVAIIEHTKAIFGGTLPYDEYQFLCMFTDAGRGGLEHVASSALLAPRTTFEPPKDYRSFMGLVAHEFFHVWNVKRMRPAELWEFDYENEDHTELLWVAEGFTAYYDDLLCRRAGILSAKQYLRIVADGIAELRRTPGRLHQSLSQASYDAWIRLYRPDENTRNSTLSYYGNGALAALCIDLRIRVHTDGERSLDDFMRLLFERTFGAGRGYTYDDVVSLLGEVAGEDLSELVHSLVHESLDPDFDAVLAPLGLTVQPKHADDADDPYIGVHFKSGTTTLSSIQEDGPAYRAGLMPQDEILALDGLRVSSNNWIRIFDAVSDSALEKERSIAVLVARRGRVITVDTLPGRRPPTSLTITVSDDASADADRLRRAWLCDRTY